MVWIEPQFSKSAIDRAGRTLIGSNNLDEISHALDIINNFRASHSFPLNTVQCGIRRSVGKVTSDAVVAQRIKRLPSILYKLERNPQMRLSAMQDIAGCRAVVPTVDNVYNVISTYRKSRIKHKVVRLTDYITTPKESGYRGCHLIYRYYSDKTTMYNDLNVEVQVRTSLQHAWATAVETAGMFMQQSLKSSVGETGWLRFFALAGAVHAHQEEMPSIPTTPADYARIKAEMKTLDHSLGITPRLLAYNGTLTYIDTSTIAGAHYYLLQLDFDKMELDSYGYKRNNFEEATQHYAQVEKDSIGRNIDVVLVSGDTVAGLKRAYPNYFADTHVFLNSLEEVLS